MSLISLKGLEAGFVCVCDMGRWDMHCCTLFLSLPSCAGLKRVSGSRMSCTSVGAHVEKEKAYSTWYSHFSPIQVLTRPDPA